MQTRISCRFLQFFLLVLVGSTFLFSQKQPPLSDPQAVALVQAAVTAMGGSQTTAAPQDSTAIANVTVTSGTSLEQGSLKATTRGLDQTAEEITLPSGVQRLVYSQGSSNDKRPDASPGEDPFSYELSLSAQSPIFPLPWLVGRMASADTAVVNLGSETQSNVTTTHVSLTNTFTSAPDLAQYSTFTVANVWLDSTGLPLRISYERHSAGGDSPAVSVAYEYSDYRSVQGFLYPFQIRKFVNGTIWASICVQTVQFNTGLSAADFSLQ
jgi:hypothetical protein